MEIETLGDCLTHSVTVRVFCAFGPYTKGMQRGRECNWSYLADMETLVLTRGRDFPISLLRERVRCPRCGSRRLRVMFSVPTNSGEVASAMAARRVG